MRLRTIALGFGAAVMALVIAGAPRPALFAQSAGASVPVADKGAFRVLLQGAEIGTEQFELSPSDKIWIAHSETVMRVPGSAQTRSTCQLRLSANGTPLRYDWTVQAEKKVSGSVEFDNGTAKNSVDLGGKDPVQQDFMFPSPRVVVLDNNVYYQYALLAWLYDWNAKGAQNFPVLIPQDLTPGSITVESLGSKAVEGARLDVLRVRSADLEILTYFDAKRRLMRLEVPSAKVVVVRQ